MVADLWDCGRKEGGWSQTFLRPLNDWEIEEVERFVLTLHRQNFSPLGEDKLLLKGAKDEGFSVKLMYRGLDHFLAIEFHYRSIWNPVVPPKIGFFTWKDSWGKVLTLEQLKRHGRALANRCFLCKEDEDTIEHLLIHCKKKTGCFGTFF